MSSTPNVENTPNAEICELTHAELDAVTGGDISKLIDKTMADRRADTQALYCKLVDPMACQR